MFRKKRREYTIEQSLELDKIARKLAENPGSSEKIMLEDVEYEVELPDDCRGRLNVLDLSDSAGGVSFNIQRSRRQIWGYSTDW